MGMAVLTPALNRQKAEHALVHYDTMVGFYSKYLETLCISTIKFQRVHPNNFNANDLLRSINIVMFCFFLLSSVFLLPPAVPCHVPKEGNIQLA